MASDGPRFGTTVDDVTDSAGTITWANPGNADESASGLLATAALTTISQSHFLHTTYGFAIPAGSTINGIEMIVRRNKSGASVGITDKQVRLYKGGVASINADKSDVVTNYTTSFVIVTYGSPTDKWNNTWTPADINSGFGTAFCCGEGGSGAGTAQVDYIQATVYYTPPPPPPGPMANAQIRLQTERAV